jgi:RNA polymerase sigma-70 factor, ECF subfamily
VNAPADAVESQPIGGNPDFESLFHAHYARIARVIVRVVRDPARAEDLAVDVFWKFWRKPPREQNGSEGGWLYRAAVRLALDEVRKQARKSRRESQAERGVSPTPEDVRAAAEQADRVTQILISLESRQAELLLLRTDGLSYADIAVALDLNPASVGTLIRRAQQAFRKEYVRKYGQP